MIIARSTETMKLASLFDSDQAEFAVVYGRRRVGKTYLIREFFKQQPCKLLHATGIQKGTQKSQLIKFTESVSEVFFNGIPLKDFLDWGSAFKMVNEQINKSSEKVVIFLDELPWMAGRKSTLMQELDYYWNHYWSQNKNVLLIVCGSSASWLIRKIIYNKGGLHNRITFQLRLSPFNLQQVEEYLKYKNIHFNHKAILSLYMAIGGIPYYLNYVKSGLSVEQNIQQLFFNKEAPLANEFNKLFHSLFNQAQAYIELVKIIAKRKSGINRSELQKSKHSSNGGNLTNRLNDLVEAGFIQQHLSIDKSRGEYYKLIDEFCLFYLHWNTSNKLTNVSENYWILQTQQAAYYAWSGYAYEAICFKHIEKIIKALNIDLYLRVYSWRYIPKSNLDQGAQIDLIIERADNAITICEIKFSDQPFIVNKEFAADIHRKIEVFSEKTQIKKQILFALITAYGTKFNNYAKELITGGIVAFEDLFSHCKAN